MPPLVSVQVFLRVFAWAGHGRAGPWALAPGRWVAGKEAGPFAGRHHRGQLCCVGASSLALCSLRAWSQTAPLFSCWDCWEVGRPDWGVWAGGRDTRCQALTGPVSMLLQVRPGIKVQRGSGPSSLGLAGGGIPLGLWAAPRQQVCWCTPAFPHCPAEASGPSTMASPHMLPSSSRPREVPCPLALVFSLLFVPTSLPRPCHAQRLPVPVVSASSLPAGSVPRGLYLPLPAAVSLLPPPSVPPSLPPCLSPSAPVAPASLGSISKSLSGSPYLCLSWPGLHVPVSLGACAWVGMGVSLEKSLLASPLQLQAGCHGNRVRGPPPPRCNS